MRFETLLSYQSRRLRWFRWLKDAVSGDLLAGGDEILCKWLQTISMQPDEIFAVFEYSVMKDA